MNIVDFVDNLEAELAKQPSLHKVTIKAFAADPPRPDQCPFLNILPKGKFRERIPIIGGQKHYTENPEARIEVFHCSASDLKTAFVEAEKISDSVLVAIDGISSTVLGAIDHEATVEAGDGYDLAIYDNYMFAKVSIVVTARDAIDY